MLKHLLRRFGKTYTALMTTIFAVIAAVSVTSLLIFILQRGTYFISSVIAAICAVIIATPLTIYFFQLMDQIDRSQQETKETNEKLMAALDEVKELSGLLPICTKCKKIRDSEGYWNQIETYIEKHSTAQFTHGLCEECAQILYGDQSWFNKR